jgi:hypothetical protein
LAPALVAHLRQKVARRRMRLAIFDGAESITYSGVKAIYSFGGSAGAEPKGTDRRRGSGKFQAMRSRRSSLGSRSTVSRSEDSRPSTG